MTISCIFGIEDPLRDGIPKTIQKLGAAGVRVRMCTGDNVQTARSISEKAGIIVDIKDDIWAPKDVDLLFENDRKKYQCMLGQEFREEFGKKD